MKNHKILENRNELTNKEVLEGMDFNKILKNSVIYKKNAFKYNFIKVVIGAITVSAIAYAGISYMKHENKQIVSEQINNEPTEEVIMQQQILETENIKNTENKKIIHAEKNIAGNKNALIKNGVISNKENINKENQLNFIEHKDSTLQIQQTKAVEQKEIYNGNSIVDTVALIHKNTNKTNLVKSNINATCKIWDTKNFCDFPESAKSVTSINCDGCDYDLENCTDINSKVNVKGVWMTLIVNKKTKISIESNLKNVFLTKRISRKVIQPLMINIGSIQNSTRNDAYLGKNFKAKRFEAYFNSKTDIFLLFNDAEKGDIITIDKFLQIEVQ